jgi:hypothetical protein
MASREKYKVVNPYAVCHSMKKQYGWTSQKKWQRCVVQRIIDNSEFCQPSRRKRKSYPSYRSS